MPLQPDHGLLPRDSTPQPCQNEQPVTLNVLQLGLNHSIHHRFLWPMSAKVPAIHGERERSRQAKARV